MLQCANAAFLGLDGSDQGALFERVVAGASDDQTGSPSAETASPDHSSINAAEGSWTSPSGEVESGSTMSFSPPACSPAVVSQQSAPSPSQRPPSPALSPPSVEGSSTGPSRGWLRGRAKLTPAEAKLTSVDAFWNEFR